MAQQKKKLSHARELYYIVFILAVVLLGAFSIWGPDGFIALKSAQRELQVRRTRVEALQRSNTERMRSIKALKSDKSAIENYARTKGYVKKGELIQHLPEQSQQK